MTTILTKAFQGIRSAGKLATRDPLTATGTGLFLGETVGAPLSKSVLTDTLGDNARDLVQSNRFQRMQMARAQRLNSAMQQNMTRLAALNPHLYNEVAAGRRLPRGATVIGGQVREDLLEQLAYHMSVGSFKPQQPQRDLLSEIAS